MTTLSVLPPLSGNSATLPRCETNLCFQQFRTPTAVDPRLTAPPSNRLTATLPLVEKRERVNPSLQTPILWGEDLPVYAVADRPILPAIDRTLGWLSPQKAVGLFAAGFGVGFGVLGLMGAGRLRNVMGRMGLLQKVSEKELQKLAQQAETFTVDAVQKGQAVAADAATNTTANHRVQIYTSFMDGLTSLFQLASNDPNQRSTFALYGVVSAVGFLSSQIAQGFKEAWVRSEESAIRSNALERLPKVFRKSIQQKQAIDLELETRAQQAIFDLLDRYGVRHPETYLTPTRPIESLETQRNFYVQPTHRDFASALKFSRAESDPLFAERYTESVEASFLPEGKRGQLGEETPHVSVQTLAQAGVMGAGALAGLITQGVYWGMKSLPTPKASPEFIQNVTASGMEGLLVEYFGKMKNIPLLSGFFLISAMAGLGKLFVEGLREIQVTRLNAETEYRYQQYNWGHLDPSFHQIAEEEALNRSLAQFEQDLPQLKNTPDILKQRIQTLLANVSRASAPPYFPMTPAFSLVEARG